MDFEWNEDKAKSNKRKHGIGFEMARQVFFDPNNKEYYNGMYDGEERWSVIGNTDSFIIVTVICTMRGIDKDIVRIISARRANKDEQRKYYQIEL